MSKGHLLAGAAVLLAGVSAQPAVAQTAGATAKPVKPLTRNIRAFTRNIRAFWGDVNPFTRNIRAFWGDVDPFTRNIRAFWGNIDPVLNATVAGAPQFSTLAPFWEQTGAQWEVIASKWQTAGGYAGNEALYGQIGTDLNALVTRSELTWGAAVLARTGKSFRDGFSNPHFARFGVDPSNPESLARLRPEEQSQLFVEYYDNLMTYSGVDHPDHWMKAINWTPSLTQTQGGGSDAVIGLVDFFIAGDADIKSKVVYSGGVSNFSTGHGAGVGSLIVASHDGKGVMGIAPKAKVAAYNPFDETGSAGWADVRRGIEEVTVRGAAVVNLSLGVPGTTFSGDWRSVFVDSKILDKKDKTLYVIAAGNDGHTQTANVNMKDAFDNTFIVVGSVDPAGKISEFSNRPGHACLLDDRDCKDDPRKTVQEQLKMSGLLMRRFIVAPGELILVSDDAGGITRQSGTSLAAPLVSGAIALIHDRWPWMKNHPRDVAAMILRSAKDLGDPGVDATYGVGMLDVEAAQSPLNFGALKIYYHDGNLVKEQSTTSVQQAGVRTIWETKGTFFSAFEKFDGAERDFLIPLATRLVGTQRSGQFFQDYIYDQMVAWMAQRPAGTGITATLGFAPGDRNTVAAAEDGWRFSMAGRLSNPFALSRGAFRPQLQTTAFAEAPSGRIGLAMGYGDGAVALGAGAFGLASDLDPFSGGANPLLGFAMGGAHMAATAGLGETTQVSLGVTRSDRFRSTQLSVVGRHGGNDPSFRLSPYESMAANLRADWQVTPALTVNMGLTRLTESGALLGVRSLATGDFRGGSASTGVTMGATGQLGSGFSVAVTATASRTTSADRDAAFRIGRNGLTGTAYQLAVGKTGLLGAQDNLRLSFAQPMAIEGGQVEFRSVQVVDRGTGQIGTTVQYLPMGTQPRRYAVEANYALPLPGVGTVSAFGRHELGARQDGVASLVLGAQAQIAF